MSLFIIEYFGNMNKKDSNKILCPFLFELGVIILLILSVTIQYLLGYKIQFEPFLVIIYIFRLLYAVIAEIESRIYREVLEFQKEDMNNILKRNYENQLDHYERYVFNWFSLFLFILFFTIYSLLFPSILSELLINNILYVVLVIRYILLMRKKK